MRVLVTGATGFIGYHVARRLRSEGHEVRALVRRLEKGRCVLGALGCVDQDLVEGEMEDAAAVERALEGAQAVIHAAASVSVTTGRTDFSANLLGTENVMGQAAARDIYAVFLSSVTAIFDPKNPPTEESPLVRSRTHYGRSKAECDALVRKLQADGARASIVYPPGVVGPDDPGMSESVKAYRSFLRGTLRSEGGNQMLDVRDLAILLVSMVGKAAPGRVIAAGHYFDWDEFTALIEGVTGAEIPRISAPGWALRLAGRALDKVAWVTGRPMPMTGEGVEIATRFPRMSDSRQVSELGLVWRDPRETIRDLYAWFLESGKLPARAVPLLAPGIAEGSRASRDSGP